MYHVNVISNKCYQTSASCGCGTILRIAGVCSPSQMVVKKCIINNTTLILRLQIWEFIISNSRMYERRHELFTRNDVILCPNQISRKLLNIPISPFLFLRGFEGLLTSWVLNDGFIPLPYC